MNERLTKLQANALRDAGQLTEVFKLSGMGDFNISGILSFIKNRSKPYPTQRVHFEDVRAVGVDETSTNIMDWLVSQREVDEERVKALTDKELDEPIIVMFDEEFHATVIDGIHRLVGRYRRGDKDYEFYPIPIQIAREYMIPTALVDIFEMAWGEKDLDGSKLRNIRTGERT